LHLPQSIAQNDAKVLFLGVHESSQIAIRQLLESQGLAVNVAFSIDEAITCLERQHHDLLLLELDQAEHARSGIGLIEKLRTQIPELPMVIVSSVRDAESAIAAMRLGASDYLFQPIDATQLIQAVDAALNTHSALKERDAYEKALQQAVSSRTEMLRHALNDLEQACDFTLEALGDALDLRDAETEGHSRRVTAYCMALARAMGLSSEEVKVIARGAFLHDIGKMGIPDAILLKPGPLDTPEKSEMRTHCDRGYAVVKKIPFLNAAAEIVYAHQEHFDGSGYPRGLKGEEIHLGARIFAVADTLDAITSDRPYRKARDFDFARAEIVRCSGTQFDPAVVETFRQIPNSFWEQIRGEIAANKFHLTNE
jgi:putative nucleotidyltransferase with HDIG domain